MGTVYGVGINDRSVCGPGSFKVAEGKWEMFPEYQMWKGIMNRCFSDKEKSRRPACLESRCCDEWKYRSNFQNWYHNQKYRVDSTGKTLQIDKDILFVNNQIYSSETSVLVPQYVNLSVRKLSTDVPWVSKTPKGPRMLNDFRKPWQYSILCGDITYKRCALPTQLDAHLEAQIHKINYLYEIIERYSKEDCYDPRVEQGIINRINILQKAHHKKRICRIF